MTRNLDSVAECAIARIVFMPAAEYDFPIITFSTQNALSCAVAMKKCILIDRHSTTGTMIAEQTGDAIRVEHQALHAIGPRTSGMLYLLDGAAHFRGKHELPMSVWALTIPGDANVRWYWTILSSVVVLKHLGAKDLISPPQAIERNATQHQSLYTTIKTLFEHFTHMPDSPDFKQAEQMTDYCPDIEDPDTACQRLEIHPYLYHSYKGSYRDMSDDRYLLELEPAERIVASIMDVTAAKYLLIKRVYFKDLMKELRENRDKIPVPLRVATHRPVVSSRRHVRGQEDSADEHDDTASRASTPGADGTKSGRRQYCKVRKFEKHIYRMRSTNDWPYSKARAVVEAWTELGFLNEESFVDWIDYGGMFETIGLEG